jgi:hypothetical protein
MFLGRLTEKIVLLTREVIELTRELKRCRKVISLRKPGLVYVLVTSEESGMLKFKVKLSPPGAADVVGRELTVKVGDAEATTVTLAGDATESAEMTGADNAVVSGSLTDVDDAGNRSESRLFEGTLTDTIAPPQPGELAIEITGEE